MDNLKRLAPDFNGPSLRNQEDFEPLFADWYGGLYHYAYSVLKDVASAEEVVQSVFCAIWEKRDKVRVNTSMKAYLFSSFGVPCLHKPDEGREIDKGLFPSCLWQPGGRNGFPCRRWCRIE